MSSPVPVFLLKTKSEPQDRYELVFTACQKQSFTPIFVPVLDHRLRQDDVARVKALILNGGFANGTREYGGIIFTSQRAVDALGTVVAELRSTGHDLNTLLPTSLTLYVVGPATADSIRALQLPCNVSGEGTGNGDLLAKHILEHYDARSSDVVASQAPPLLFLVGEERRDIIPRTLQSETLAEHERVKVDEIVVYHTRESESFATEFERLFHREDGIDREKWVVVFSPQGCRTMLRLISFLDEDGNVKAKHLRGNTLIATIGPTTRAFLLKEFGLEADACAAKPSPEALLDAIVNNQNPD